MHFTRLLLLAALVLGASQSFAVEITAHRGASYTAPENTLAAVNLAWKLGAESVEVDVYQSSDRKIVVLHDKDTRRTSGVELVVKETPFKDLRKLDVGSKKGKRWAGEKIPTLAEVLETVPEGKRLLIEIKCGAEVVPELVRVLARSGKERRQYIVICFNKDVLVAVKRAIPKLHVQWLVGKIPERNSLTRSIRVSLADVIGQCKRLKFDGLSVKRDGEINEQFVKQVDDAGLELHVWTVNSPDEARRLSKLGVDAITTDRPGLLRRELNLVPVEQ